MEHTVQKALLYMERGKISEALEEFSYVLQHDQNNFPALVGKARCLLHYIYDTLKLDEGQDIINKIIIDLKHESPEILLLKAKFLWRRKHHNDALTQIEYLKNTWGSENPELLYTEARILASDRKREFKNALKISEKLPKRERDFILGRIEHIKGLSAQTTEEKNNYHKKAIGFFQRSFEIDFATIDDSAVDNFIISNYHIKHEENLNEAIKIGEKFILKNPNSYITNKIVLNVARCIRTKMELPNQISNRKQISKEYTDFVQNIQSKQNELFEPEQINYAMTRLLSPLVGKPSFYNTQGLHREALIALDEYSFFNDGLNENTISSKVRKSEYFAELAFTYHHTLEVEKAIEEYHNCIITIENIIDVVLPHTLSGDSLNVRKLALYANIASMVSRTHECIKYLDKQGYSTTTQKANREKFERYLDHYEDFPTLYNILKEVKKIKLKYKSKNAPKPLLKHSGNEGEHLEFKSSFFLHGAPPDMTSQERNAKEEKGFAEIAESVCAFLNTDGGDVIIGVDDDKNCLGIEADIQKTKKKTYDAYTKTITDKISSKLNEKYPNFIDFGTILYPEDAADEQVRLYRIFVQPLPYDEPYPATVKTGNSPVIVYYRTGDSDASYKYEDGIREWNRRKSKQS